MSPVRGSKICVDCAGHKYSVERYDIYPILKMHVDYFATIAPVHGMPVSFLPLFPDCRVFITIFIWCIVLCPCCGLGGGHVQVTLDVPGWSRVGRGVILGISLSLTCVAPSIIAFCCSD